MTVTATGTLSAVTTVQVGSQVSGVIARLYADFNSHVKKGQLLAELDPTPFQPQVEQRQADVTKAQVEAANAQDQLRPPAASGESRPLAAGRSRRRARRVRRRAMRRSQQSHGGAQPVADEPKYTKIISPIDGVVVDRQYDVGQTVAASFSGADALLRSPRT